MRVNFQTKLTLLLFLVYLLGAGVGTVLAADGGITFEAGPQLDTARMGHAAATLPDGRVALFGGHGTGFVPLKSAEIWSPATNSFTSYDMQYTHDGCAIAKLSNGNYLLAGGTSNSSGVGYTDTAEVFNPNDNTFTATGKMTYPRTNDAAATLTGGKVLVVGSWYNTTYASYGDLYDPVANTFTATGALNTARAHPLVLPTADGKAVVCGGMDPYGGSYIEQVELYDPATNSFSVLQDNLLTSETGWLTFGGVFQSNGRSVDTQKMPDGRYIFIAFKQSGGYALLAFDPTAKTFTKLTTSTQVSTAENGTVSFQLAPVVNSSLNQAYLVALKTASYGTLPTQTVLFTENLANGGSCPDVSGTAAVDYYFGYMGVNLLQDGRLFFTGGTADPSSTNFSPSNATFFGTTDSSPQKASNLLSNPGAETGDLTDWTPGGPSVPGPGVDDGTYDSGINPQSGSYDFYGGVNQNDAGFGTLNQTVDLIGGGFTAAQIDSGTLVAKVSFYEQSLDQGSPSDGGFVTLTFLDASNSALGTTTQLGGDSVGAWQEFSGSYAIPVGTRSITYTMSFVLEQGENIDSFIDGNSLTVTTLWQDAYIYPNGGGWENLGWFGDFNVNNSPWIYHQMLGWLFPVGTSTDNLWFYDPQWDGSGGWWWTSTSFFPWVYSATESEWLYYDANDSTPGARWFFTTGGQASVH